MSKTRSEQHHLSELDPTFEAEETERGGMLGEARIGERAREAEAVHEPEQRDDAEPCRRRCVFVSDVERDEHQAHGDHRLGDAGGTWSQPSVVAVSVAV